MDKRYQVFVSSTYEDLKEERKEVMQALLELKCIPAGMELFQAANTSQWKVIQRVIDDSDYYVVIIGGRYGSTNSDGVSFTEMEYNYACSVGKPILAFLHGDPGSIPRDKFEDSDAGKQKLEQFRETLKNDRLIREWKTPSELGGVVTRGIVNIIQDEPAIGWIKADSQNTELELKLLQYKERIDELERNQEVSLQQPINQLDSLAHGEDEVAIAYTLWETRNEYRDSITNKVTEDEYVTNWLELCRFVLPNLLNWESDSDLRKGIQSFIFTEIKDKYPEIKEKNERSFSCTISRQEYHMITIQLQALGLIEVNLDPVKPWLASVYWRLTPFGNTYMSKMLARKR